MMRSVLCVILVLVSAFAAGCNIIGGTIGVFSPPQKIEARYALPDKPTLILVDDRKGLVNNETLLRQIANSARAALEAEEVVTVGFIGQDALAKYRADLGEAYESTSLTSFAINLDAKQIIHAEVAGYRINVGGDVIRPAITLEVKVYDIDAIKTHEPPGIVFPGVNRITGAGSTKDVYTMTTELKSRDVSGQSAARSLAARELAEQTGRDLGRLFFDWRVPERGSELNDR